MTEEARAAFKLGEMEAVRDIMCGRRIVEAREALLTELRERVEWHDSLTTTVSGAQRGPLLSARHGAYAAVLAIIDDLRMTST